jgi:hypothetical protein
LAPRLESFEEIAGEVKTKIQLADRQWVRVVNPFEEKTRDIRQGESEIRVGPLAFALQARPRPRQGRRGLAALSSETP